MAHGSPRITFVIVELGSSLDASRIVADLCRGHLLWFLLRLSRECRLGPELLAGASCARCNGEGRAPDWLHKVEEKLHDEMGMTHTLSSLAQTAGVHPVYLSRVFRQMHGESVGAHLRRLRIQEAAQRLLQTDTPLASLSCDLGFTDQSHFTHAFKRLTGLTPGEFRSSFSRLVAQ